MPHLAPKNVHKELKAHGTQHIQQPRAKPVWVAVEARNCDQG